ncbi:MAG: serine hydrolase [Bacteroidota bacterium]
MQRTITFLFFVQISFSTYSQGIQDSILRRIKDRGLETHSDALIVQQNGNTIYKDYYGKEEAPIYIASAGKSLTSLAIGKLIDDKLLDSLDQPIYTIYPQWKQGNKKNITIRMLLNHTSGIQNHPNASFELEPPPDYKIGNIIELALAAELSDMPGEKVNYNNKAVALLGGIVQKVSGTSFDSFFETHFFKPLHIQDFDWIRDKSGNPTVHGAFVLKPSDLMKFGELLINKGIYKGQRIISEEWIHRSLKQSQDFTPIWGFLWWRFPEYERRIIDDEIWESWKEAKISEDFMNKMEPLKGVLYGSKGAFYNALKKNLGENWTKILNANLPSGLRWSKKIFGDSIKAYYANGYRGNYLVVVPQYNIVAVRCADFDGFDYETDFYPEFIDLVSKLGK